MRRWLIVCIVLILWAWGPVAAQPDPDPVACTGRTAPDAGSTAHTLEVDGLTRIYRLFVPEGYDASQPVPLVLSLHGAVSSAQEQQEKTQWDEIAAREGFITAYPQGILPLAFGWRWNAGESLMHEMRPDADNIDDVAFIRDLIAHLGQTLCIDAQRVYVTGFSNGGGMSNHLACELADVIAAIGTVAGAYTPIAGGCTPSRPVPVITLQGTHDRIVPYAGNPDIGLQGVEDWAREWAARNGCADEATPIAVEASEAVRAVMYGECDAPVAVYILADGGHTWPGGLWKSNFLLGRTITEISASEVMWEFFAAHPLAG